MNIGTAPRLFAGRIEAGMPIGRPHNPDHLALTLNFAAADTSSLWNVFAGHERSSKPKRSRQTKVRRTS
jgi:hypothetical protein